MTVAVARPVVQPEPGPATSAIDRGLAVLVIEDDDWFAELAMLMLGSIDVDVDHAARATSWAEAEAILRSRPVDLVLTDLSLPDADGLDVVRRCHEMSDRTPIIVLTGCDEGAVALECLQHGAQDYLVKQDLTPSQLSRSVRYTLARAQAREALQATLHQLEQSNRQLEEYATIASHDLRSPVRTARVIAGRLLTVASVREDEAVASLVAMLDGSLTRLDGMLEGLLDYAQAGDIAAAGAYADQQLGPVVSEVMADVAADLAAANGTVDLVDDGVVHAHPVLLRSLLTNLVGNAVKYRSDRPLRVEIAQHRLIDGSAVVRVGDNGIGIAPEFRTRVFAMFERLEAPGEGHGLGLTLCHRIVSLHGGRIWIEDGTGGVGTVVCCTFPAGE